MTTKRFLFFITLGMLALGCTDASQIGANFINSDHLLAFQVDTVSMKAYTVYLDSAYSQSSTRFLAGAHRDEKLGTITSQPYFTLKTNTGSELNDIQAEYDHASLVLVYDKYSYYDTLQSISLSVHRVTEDIKGNAEDGRFYNTMSFKHEPTPLGSLNNFHRYPRRNDTLEINLNEAFGRDLFEKAQAQAQELKTDADFVDYLKGMTVKCELADSPFLGFSPQAELRIYYKNNSLVPEQTKILKFTSSDTKFNSIKSDRTGTDLENLNERIKPLPSANSGNTAYIQGGTPIGTRIEFPYLKRILLDNPDLILAEAYLEVWPTDDSQRGNTVFPTSITMTLANSRNELQQMPNTWPSTASLETDPLYGKDFYYRANIKPYISTELSPNDTGSALLLLLTNTDITSSVNRLYLNTGRTDRTLKLKLYFITPKL